MHNQTKNSLGNHHGANTIKRTLCFVFVTMYVFGGFSKLYAQKKFVQRGIASYYTDRFDGRTTASGEIFDNEELVGSHKKLSFGTMVKVTNLANGRSVVVRINDRGPYAHGRIIDVSKKAAVKIGLYATGAAKVLIEAVGTNGVVSINTTKKETPPVRNNTTNNPARKNIATGKAGFRKGKTYSPDGLIKTPHGFGLQVGYFSNLASAQKHCRKVKTKTNIHDIFIQVGWANKGQHTYYRVLVGSFATREMSSLTQRQLSKAGLKGFLKPHQLK